MAKTKLLLNSLTVLCKNIIEVKINNISYFKIDYKNKEQQFYRLIKKNKNNITFLSFLSIYYTEFLLKNGNIHNLEDYAHLYLYKDMVIKRHYIDNIKLSPEQFENHPKRKQHIRMKVLKKLLKKNDEIF